jgi:hypothetical protein
MSKYVSEILSSESSSIHLLSLTFVSFSSSVTRKYQRMAFSASIWPPAPILVDRHIKELITRFFEISDSTDSGSGQLFAEELFAEDGIFKTHETCIFKGRDG